MGMTTFRTGITRATLTIVAAMAIAYSLLVPQGFMTTRGAGGGLLVVICTGHGPANTLTMSGMGIGMDHGKSGHHGSDSTMRCPFAGHAAPSAPGAPEPALADLPPDFGLPPSLPLGTAAPGRGMPAPPTPSRAPPRLVA